MHPEFEKYRDKAWDDLRNIWHNSFWKQPGFLCLEEALMSSGLPFYWEGKHYTWDEFAAIQVDVMFEDWLQQFRGLMENREMTCERCGRHLREDLGGPVACSCRGNTEAGFQKELEHVINKYSKENGSNTPDHLLAQYLVRCLDAFNEGVRTREMWYGRNPSKGPGGVDMGEGAHPLAHWNEDGGK